MKFIIPKLKTRQAMIRDLIEEIGQETVSSCSNIDLFDSLVEPFHGQEFDKKTMEIVEANNRKDLIYSL